MAATTYTLLTPTVIAKEALMLLENNLVMGNLVHKRYKNEFQKVGGTVTIRKPVKFQVTKARTRVATEVTEQSTTISVATQAHVSWGFHTKDLTLTIEEYSQRYIYPAAAALANTIDADLCGLYKYVSQAVRESTDYITPENFIVLGNAAQKLDEAGCPPENRVIALNPAANWSLANALKSIFVEGVAKPALQGGVAIGGPPKGYRATIAGFDVYMDQNIKAHTTGAWYNTGSAYTATGSERITIKTTGGSAVMCTAGNVHMINFKYVDSQVLKAGDIFTIAGVYAVNPMSGESTGALRQFVVTADASCTGSSTVSEAHVIVNFDPPMIDTGPYRTVDTLPASQAHVTVMGRVNEPYPQNLAFHQNAFALVTVPLEMPHDVWGARETHNGLSIRILKAYDIDEDDEVCRLDVLYGIKCLYPDLACRIYGAEG